MDESGVPTAPANPFSYKHELEIGAAIGILLCVFLDVLLALGKNTVKKEEDFKRLFHVDSLGVLPHAKFHKKRTQVEELIVLDIQDFQEVFWKRQEPYEEELNVHKKKQA